jgi:hypothetical protein
MNLVFVIQEAPVMLFKRVVLFPVLSNSSSLLRRGIAHIERIFIVPYTNIDPLDPKLRKPFGDLHRMLIMNAFLRPADKPLIDRRNQVLMSKS